MYIVHMNILFTVYVFVLFFVLTPGVLLRLPPKGSKVIVALVHGLVFAAILAVSGYYLYKFSNRVFEGLVTEKNDLMNKLTTLVCKLKDKTILGINDKNSLNLYKRSKYEVVKAFATARLMNGKNENNKKRDKEMIELINLLCNLKEFDRYTTVETKTTVANGLKKFAKSNHKVVRMIANNTIRRYSIP